MKNLKNKKVLITGAARGIGKQIALEFAQQGSDIIICDLDNHGENEIFFGDHFGDIRAIDAEGNETIFDFLPIDTGNQIWASPLLGDIDLDGNDDVVFVSKSGFTYALDLNGI